VNVRYSHTKIRKYTLAYDKKKPTRYGLPQLTTSHQTISKNSSDQKKIEPSQTRSPTCRRYVDRQETTLADVTPTIEPRHSRNFHRDERRIA